jgi:hypothetical protein
MSLKGTSNTRCGGATLPLLRRTADAIDRIRMREKMECAHLFILASELDPDMLVSVFFHVLWCYLNLGLLLLRLLPCPASCSGFFSWQLIPATSSIIDSTYPYTYEEFLCKEPSPPPPCDRPYTSLILTSSPVLHCSSPTYFTKAPPKGHSISRHRTFTHSCPLIIALLIQVTRGRSYRIIPKVRFGIYIPADHQTADRS